MKNGHRRASATRGSATVAMVSTYPPTRCGLASFSASLVDALCARSRDCNVRVVAVNGRVGSSRGDVVARFTSGDPAHVDAVGAVLDRADAVIVQHEYGIYPGPDGASIVDLLHRVTSPAIVVLHTVLEFPSPSQRRILEQIVDASAAAVVMTRVAGRRLVERYVVDARKVRLIPHGSAMVPAAGDDPCGDRRPTLLSWGLLGPGKGLEAAIDAVATLTDLRPAPRYVIAGQIHPKVQEQYGDAYRRVLQQRAHDLGAGGLVEFDDRYLGHDALSELLHAASAVVLPYESTEQVTSGVLVDAVAGGTPVVATDFPHAVEVCDTGAGLVVPHGDTEALATALRRVLVDRQLAGSLAAHARRLSSTFSWGAVASEYLAAVDEVSRHGATWPSDPLWSPLTTAAAAP